MNGEIVMPNLAELRAAVFTLSGKNLRGVDIRPPPPSVRGLNYFAERVKHKTGAGHEPHFSCYVKITYYNKYKQLCKYDYVPDTSKQP